MYPTIDKRATGQRIRKIMDNKGIKPRDIQTYLGLACVQSVYRWLDGTSLPSVDNIYALSQLFDVSMDTMICGNRERLDDDKDKASRLRLILYIDKLSRVCVA